MKVTLHRFKVAYWTDGKLVQSKMFRSLSGARGFIDTLPKGTVSTLMEAETIGDSEYSWKVLPDGVGKYLPVMTTVFQNRLWACLGLMVGVLYTRKQGKSVYR